MFDLLYSVLIFLISTACNLYLSVLIIRLILAGVHADYFNPITQFIVTLTNITVNPIRKHIPNISHLETATLLIAFLVSVIKFLFITPWHATSLTLLGITILACADLIKLIIQTFFYAILLQAIASWLRIPFFVHQLLYQITAPIILPFRRIIPPVTGIDLSPIPAMITLQLLNMIIVNPLIALGAKTLLS